MAKKITRELFLSFPYIVLVQDKVLFTQIPASSSSLLLSWWRGVCPVGEVVQVIPATFVETNPVTRVSDMVWRRLNLILTTKHALRLSCALVHIYSCGNRNALKGSCLKYPPRMPKCPFLSPWMYFLLQHCVASKTPPEYLLLRGECFLTSRRREIAPQTMVNYITMSPMRRRRI